MGDPLGLYYNSDREGDFLILGPTGEVLVLEVKGGELRKLSANGRWEGTDRDHPLTQLLAEWQAILAQLQETAAGRAVPFVAKALCLADLTVDSKILTYREIDRNLIVDRGDLAAFETTWGRLFARRDHPVPDDERKVFLDSCTKDISPKEVMVDHQVDRPRPGTRGTRLERRLAGRLLLPIHGSLGAVRPSLPVYHCMHVRA